MRKILKQLPVVRELIRLIDANFAQLHSALLRLDEVRNSQSLIGENDKLALARLEEAGDALTILAKNSTQAAASLDDLGKAELSSLESDKSVLTALAHAIELLSQLQSDNQRLMHSLDLAAARDQKLQSGHTALRKQFRRLWVAVSESGQQWLSDGAALRGQLAHLTENGEQRLSDNAAMREQLARLSENGNRLTETLVDLRTQNQAVLDGISKRPVNVATSKYGLLNPEVSLLQYLYSYLPSRNALDIGANAGDFSARLVQAGYAVYAFEPYLPVYEKLSARLGAEQAFRSMPVAIGSSDHIQQLHIAADRSGTNKYKDATLFSSLAKHSMPEDLVFTDAVEVQVRSLDSLLSSGDIPAGVGLIKIDTEGYDLEVIRGMNQVQPPVVMTEFWDPAQPFGRSGASNRLDEQVKEMRQRGYLWYLVIYRIDGSYQISYYCNRSESVDNSWGNVVFINDYEIFSRALQWCEATLPPTYFQG